MTSCDWTLRVPDAGDADAIAYPIHACGLFAPHEAEGFVAMLPDLLADPSARWRVLERDGAVRGAAYASRERMSADVWNLWFIGLAAPDQGRGGGTRLLAGIEDAARGEDGRLLLVETSSASSFVATRAFYAVRGYQSEARIRDYYAAGEDKIVFRKML